MKTIVVGGQWRAVGKTAVIEGILRAFPGHSWTAVKVTSHTHKEYGSRACEIFEETNRSGATDTGRYLAAGAERALLVQVRPGCLQQGISEMSAAVSGAPLLIVESNRAVPFLRPDIFVFVVRRDRSDWKSSARESVAHADAVIVVSQGPGPGDVPAIPAEPLRKALVFETTPPEFAPEPFLDWIAARIAG